MNINKPSIITNNLTINKVDFGKSVKNKFENRYIKPPKVKEIPYRKLKYDKAVDLVHDIDFQSLDRVFCIVSGNFVFSDFLEAFIVENNILVEEMTISTLSYSQHNIDSLKALIEGDFVQKLDLIISDYFYSHERSSLIKYAYENLDIDNKFQLAAAGTHCKTYQFKTEGGKHIVCHGSVNMRSSGNIEQFVIEDNKELYDFNKEYQDLIIDRYKTINKSIRGNQLFKTITNG